MSNIIISSGHGLKVRGASGILDEVDEARKVVETVAVGHARGHLGHMASAARTASIGALTES